MASVDQIIADQSARAELYAGNADDALRAAITDAMSHFTDVPNATISWDPATLLTDVPTTVEQYITAQYVAPGGNPGSFDTSTIQQLDQIAAANMPTRYEVNTTGLFDDAKPVITTAAFSTPTPIIDFTEIDNALAGIAIPTITEYQAPSLTDITVRDMPNVTVPTFDVTNQATDPGALTGVREQFVADYERVLPEMRAFIDDSIMANWVATYSPNLQAGLAALESRLQDGLDRGTALPQEYETALYNRSRSRVEKEFNRAIREIEVGRPRSGFEIPPMSRTSGIAQAHQAAADALAIQATEIYIKKSEQEIQHIQFVLTTSATLRQTMIQAALGYAGVIAQINQLANEQAKFQAELSVDIYKTQLARFQAQLEVYKTEAAIYETRLKAALAQLDIYKLELESQKLIVDIDSLRIEAFAKQVQAEVARIQMYTSVLESIKTRADVQKSKIEIFAEQVRAYVAQLTGEELKTKVYLASLQGDELLLKAELAKLDAYSKQVDAEATRVKADTEIQGLRAENNRMLVDVYRSEVDGYRAQLAASLQVFEGDLKGQMASIDAYIKNLDAKVKIFETKLDRDKLTLTKAVDQAQFQQQSMMKYVDATIQSWNLQASITKDVGGMYGSLAGSALSSQNTMVSSATAA